MSNFHYKETFLTFHKTSIIIFVNDVEFFMPASCTNWTWSFRTTQYTHLPISLLSFHFYIPSYY